MLFILQYSIILPWVLIYLCAWVVVAPTSVNIILNIEILMYVRSLDRCMQPTHYITTVTILTNTQQLASISEIVQQLSVVLPEVSILILIIRKPIYT